MKKYIFSGMLTITLITASLVIPIFADNSGSSGLTDSVKLSKSNNKKVLTLQEINQEGLELKLKYKKGIEKIVNELKELLSRTDDEEKGAELTYRIALLEEKELGNKEGASENFLNCIANYPDNKYSANAYHKLADLYVKEKDYYNAVKILDKCGQEYGDLPVGRDARRKMIYIFRDKLKDMNKAIDAYKNYIYLYPEKKESAKLSEELAKIYMDRGENEKAKKLLNKIKELFPNSKEAKDSQLKLATFYRDTRDYKNEAKTLENFYKDFHDDKYAPKAAFTVGEIYEHNLIRYVRKHGYVNRKTRKREPLYKLERGSYRDAIKKYEKVYEEFPNSKYAPMAMMKISEIYDKKLYERHNMKEVLQQLTDKYPDSKEAETAKELLRNRF